jgi:hypothetical protein
MERDRGGDALAEVFRRLVRRRLVAMPETDRDGFITATASQRRRGRCRVWSIARRLEVAKV